MNRLGLATLAAALSLPVPWAWGGTRCQEKCSNRFVECIGSCKETACFARCDQRYSSCQNVCGSAPKVPKGRACTDSRGRPIKCTPEIPKPKME